ncbi:response regulator [Cereibacter sphaeroides]|uniref:response regulator n=1 Tax=Cereibacter sphaeroides TaxID=1063 RepID=UPI00399098F8
MGDVAAESLLQGRRLLVVEDEYFVAAALSAELTDLGAVVVGPAASVERALALADEALDGAILDINLAGPAVFPVAEALAARRVPFIFVTGYDATAIPQAFAHVTRLEKPVDAARVACAIGRALTGGN